MVKIGTPKYKNQHFMLNMSLQSWNGPSHKILLQSEHFLPKPILAKMGTPKFENKNCMVNMYLESCNGPSYNVLLQFNHFY